MVSVVTLAVNAAQCARRRRDRADAVTSVRSTSVKAMVPLSVRLPTGRDQLGHRAGHIGGRHDRRIVGAGDGDGDRARDAAAWPSSTSKLKVSTLGWPSARYSTAAAATL